MQIVVGTLKHFAVTGMEMECNWCGALLVGVRWSMLFAD